MCMLKVVSSETNLGLSENLLLLITVCEIAQTSLCVVKSLYDLPPRAH